MKLSNQIQYQINRSKKNIDNWILAIDESLIDKFNILNHNIIPNNTRLIDIYQQILLDSHLSATYNSRIRATLYADWSLINKKTKLVDVEATTLLEEQKWIQFFIEETIKSLFYGSTLFELSDIVKEGSYYNINELVSIERRNIVAQRKIVLSQAKLGYYQSSYIQLSDYEEEYILLNNMNDAIFMKCVPYILMKQYAMGSWASHTELWSKPMLFGKTDMDNQEGIQRMIEDLKRAGEERIILSDLNSTIDMKEVSSSGSHQIYVDLIKQCNDEISKLILGGTMTIESGSSYSQSNTHRESLDNLIYADMEYVERVINNELFPRLKNLGWKLDDLYFEYCEDKDVSLQDKLTTVDTLTKAGFMIDEQYIIDNFGVVLKNNPIIPTNEDI